MTTISSQSRGIAIAVPKKYEQTTLLNVQRLRVGLNCHLPIEIWEVGKEISPATRQKLKNIENLTFRDVGEVTNDPGHWKGYQVKAFLLKHTVFREVMICDADVVLHQNPEILFGDEKYKQNGAYFFRDLEKWQFSELTNPREQRRQLFFYNKFRSARFFRRRKEWLTSLIPEKTDLFPEEWTYIFDPQLPDKPVKEALQESGVVLMNRDKHKVSVDHIFSLNKNHKETYKYVWGDKETFWIGCVMAGEPYTFNPESGFMSEITGKLTHEYNGKIFFVQKEA